MAAGIINLQKESGGITKVSSADGTGVTELVVPESGELVNKEYADLKQSKSELAYDVSTSSYIPNTLASGAIIERGSNANGEYIKFADGTLICNHYIQWTTSIDVDYGSLFVTPNSLYWTPPYAFIDVPTTSVNQLDQVERNWFSIYRSTYSSIVIIGFSPITRVSTGRGLKLTAIGRWK